MKRILVGITAAAILMGGAIGVSGHAFASPAKASMVSITLLQPTAPVTVSAHGKIAIRVKVTGFKFDPSDVGKAMKAGMGHAHFYIDRVPVAGYTSGAAAANPSNGWAGAFTSANTVFDLSKSAVKISKGPHLLIVNLANNNHVLYKAPAAAIPFTVK